MSKKTPFGHATRRQIGTIRSQVESYLKWRRDYKFGIAGRTIPMADALLICVGNVDRVAYHTAAVMEERTRAWLKTHDTPERRKSNRMQDLKETDRVAYELAMIREEAGRTLTR